MRKLKKKLSKLASLTLITTMLLNTFLPMMTVYAEGEIVLSFSANPTHEGHTIGKQDGHLVIDNNFVDPKGLTTESYDVECNDNACTMTFDSEVTSVQLDVDNFDAFSLRAQGQVIDGSTTFTSSDNISIEHYYNPNNNNNNNNSNNNQQPYTYNEEELSFTITLNMSNNMPQNFTFETNNINTRLEVTDGDHHTFIGIDNGQHQEVAEENIYVELSQNHKTATIKIYNTAAGVMLSTPGDRNFDIDNYFGAYQLITENTTLTIVEREQEEPFDGKVLLIWQCGEEVCKHEFNLAEPQTMSYFLDTSITDDQDNTRKFDLKKALNGEIDGTYVLPSDLTEWEAAYTQENANYNFRTTDIGLMLRGRMEEIEHQLEQNGTCEHTGNPGEFERCVDEHANPTIVDRGLERRLSNGQEGGNNSYISYGDNIFKITIYTEDYAGLIEDESTYNYKRNRFDTMYSESKDISGTTQENPYVLDTLLIEGKTIISSNNINGVEFKEIKALNVPEGAVEITKISGGKFQIKFNSNFYDRTVFEITDQNDNKYYVRIVRSIVSVSVHNNDPIINKNTRFVEVDLLFDANQSWDDYEVNATIVSKDGTYKKETLTNLGAIDIGGGNVFYVQEKDFGQNLKIASFGLDLDGDEHYFESIEGIYINVRKAGTTEETYAGTYAGNGRGLFITGSERGPIIDYSK